MTQEPASARPRPSGLYRGWHVLAGAFTALLFAGIVHTSFGFFIVPVSEELKISRADTNNWLSMMSVGSALVAPLAGRLIDRFSVRLIMGIGGLTLAASFIAMSQTSSLWLLLFLALPIAFGTDCAGALSASTVAARWFRRRRGRALMIVGIATTGSGVTLAPIVAYLVGNYGWRTALPIMGVMCGAVVLSTAIFLIRSHPDEHELRDAGELAPAATQELREAQQVHEQQVWDFRRLVTNRNFLLLAFGTGLLFASDRTLLASVAPYLHDEGISLPMAGLLVSAITGSSIAGKILVGIIVDYIDPRRIFIIIAAMHIVLMAAFVLQPGYWVIFGIAIVTGLGIGGVNPLNQVLTASIFGTASYATVLGTAMVIHQVLMVGFFRFIGEVRDRTGDYQLGFEFFIGCAATATLLVWMLRLPAFKRTAPSGRTG